MITRGFSGANSIQNSDRSQWTLTLFSEISLKPLFVTGQARSSGGGDQKERIEAESREKDRVQKLKAKQRFEDVESKVKEKKGDAASGCH
jgi:hypothetical protein